MAVFSFAAMFLSLWLLPGSSLSPVSAIVGPASAAIMALFATLVATSCEGVSPAGLDNLSVPLLTGLATFLLSLL
jgi:dolichol kinase